MKKIIRITTVPISIYKLISGQPKFMQDNGFDVKLVSSFGNEIIIINQEMKLDVKIIPFTRAISPLKDLKALWLTFLYLKKEKPSIVHTHTPKAGTIGMIAAFLCKVPVRIHTVAGLPLLEAKGFKRKLLDFIEKITYMCATMVYPNSYGLKNIIIDNGYCKSLKLNVIGNGSSNGIDTQYFSPTQVSFKTVEKYKAKYKIHDKDFVFIFIGRLVSDKGLNELVKAFKAVSKKYKNAKLLMVGSRESDINRLLVETEWLLKKCTSIIQTGYQNDVRPYLSIADVLTFPSYREGFPNVVLQAGAMGLPSIVTNINGCNEIIKDNVNGVIIPVKNIEALENAMIELIENKEKFNFLTLNSRQLIVDRYEQQEVWQLIKKEYDKQLKLVGIV